MANRQKKQQQQQQKKPPKEKIDPAKMIAWLNQTGLIKHPIIAARADFAIKTGKMNFLMDFIKANPRMVDEAKQRMEMEQLVAASDPFYPRPEMEEFKPGVPCAHVLDPMTGAKKSIFMLTPSDLVRHLGIFGSAGGGKTNAIMVLCSSIRQMLGDKVRIWIFEPKDRYRDYMFPDFDVLEFRDFRDESFEPPTPKIPKHKWYDQITQFFATEQYFQAGGKNALNTILYKTLDWDRLPFPTHELILKMAEAEQNEAKSYRDKDTFTTIKLRLSSIVNFDRFSRNVRIPISEMMDRNIIFEWGDETMEMLSHRTSLLLSKLYMYKKHERSDIINIIIFEEARRHLAPRSGQFGESVLETLATLAREMLIGLVFVSHEPSSIAKVFKANVATTIAFPLSEGEEEHAIKKTMNLNPAQFEFYTRMSSLGEGNALVNYRGVNRPFPVYFPFYGEPECVSDPKTVMKAKDVFLSKFVIPENMPLFDIDQYLSPDKDKPDKPKPEPVTDDDELSESAKTILKTLYENPFLNTKDLSHSCGISGTTFGKYRDELVDKGYAKRINNIKLKKRGQNSVFLDLTDIAYAKFGWKKPSWGNRSLAHRMYQEMVSDRLQSEGWATEIEAPTTATDSGHRFDVLTWRGNQYIDYEITLSMKNVLDNVNKAFDDDRITAVILVTKDDDTAVCKERVKIEKAVYSGRVDVVPISKFFK
jgi:hypothetical protein